MVWLVTAVGLFTGPKVRATGEHGRLERVGSSCRYKPADPLVAESPGNFSRRIDSVQGRRIAVDRYESR